MLQRDFFISMLMEMLKNVFYAATVGEVYFCKKNYAY